MKKMKSYRLDEKTVKLIDEISITLSLESNSEVIRRSIALLKIVADATSEGDDLILRKQGGREKQLIII